MKLHNTGVHFMHLLGEFEMDDLEDLWGIVNNGVKVKAVWAKAIEHLEKE